MTDVAALAEGVAELFEGFSATPYRCPAGVWTFGFGSTRDGAGQPVTADTPPIGVDTARVLLERDMRCAVQTVETGVTVRLSPEQEAALADFVYNVGSGNFRSSTMLRLLNAGDFTGAAAEFDKWDRAAGRVLAGLLRRRDAERVMFTGAAT